MLTSQAERAGLLERSQEREEKEPAPAPELSALLSLQRSAGNQAVARMLLQRQAADEEDELEGEEDVAEEELPLGPEDLLEAPILADEGEELKGDGAPPAAQELQPPGPPENVLARKVELHDAGTGTWREMLRPEREAFARRHHRGRRRSLAFRIMADMASATEPMRFTDEEELRVELLKRVTSSVVMQQSQEHVAVGEGTQQAFGYPFSGPAMLYGPRVNYSARAYWTPRPPDDYAWRHLTAPHARCVKHAHLLSQEARKALK